MPDAASWPGRNEPPVLGVNGIPGEELDHRQAAALGPMIEPGIPIGGRQRLIFAGLVIDKEEFDVLIEQAGEFRGREDGRDRVVVDDDQLVDAAIKQLPL